MPRYHYINADRTLAFRDNRIIAWDPRVDAPSASQPTSPDNEVRLWRDAGSPKPTPLAPRLQPPPDASPNSPGMRTLGDIVQLEDIKQALPSANDVDALKVQTQALTELVSSLLTGGRRL